MYQDQGAPHQGGGAGQQKPDFFHSVNPQMLNLGVETTSNMLKSQRDKYMPGVSNFWNSLKLYFMVNNSYVHKKLLLLLFPFKTTNWSRISSDDAAVSLSHVRISPLRSSVIYCVASYLSVDSCVYFLSLINQTVVFSHSSFSLSFPLLRMKDPPTSGSLPSTT